MKRVLVVDDDEAIRKLVQRLFERRGYEVECATDGVEAIACLQKEEYDLVLLDLMMPRADGLQVIEEAIKLPHKPRMIVMTAAAPPIVARVPREHVKAVVTKPFDLEKLVALAEEAMR